MKPIRATIAGLLALGGILLLGAVPERAPAAVDPHQFDTPQQEAVYENLIDELRCLVCQNQNLADSNAELAQDLRRQVYEMVKGGKDKEEVVNYMVGRYGDFVLYRPPVNASTLLLWLGPLLLLAAGAVVLLVAIRRRAAEPEKALSTEERRRAEELLADKE